MADVVRILVVDDDADMRLLLRMTIALANHGLEVDAEAGSGSEALEVWRERGADVVVLDYRMPGMSGLDVADVMRRENPAQAVVLFTAYADRAVEACAQQIGVCEVVAKDRVREIPDVVRRCAA